MILGRPKRLRIIEEVVRRCRLITIANDYYTDLGLRVVHGEVPRYGPDDDLQILAVLPREDIPQAEQLEKIVIDLPIDVAVVLSARLKQAAELTEFGLADIKRAVLGGDRTFGGLLTGGDGNPEGLSQGTAEPFERQSGSDYVGVLITFVCRYVEVKGFPDRP